RTAGALGVGRLVRQGRLCRPLSQRNEVLGAGEGASGGELVRAAGCDVTGASRPSCRPQHLGHAGASRPLFDRARQGFARQRRYRQLSPQSAPHRDPVLEMLRRPARVPRGAVRAADRDLRGAVPDTLLPESAAGEGVMASVVMADDGIAFDGATAEVGPLGGAETAFVALAEALAARGHEVEARSNCAAPVQHNGVNWAPLAGGVPETCDLYIGNRSYRVMGLSRPRRRLFWLHNPGQYLGKPRNAWRLAWHRPLLVTTSRYHSSTVPAWLPDGGRAVIPYGMLDR